LHLIFELFQSIHNGFHEWLLAQKGFPGNDMDSFIELGEENLKTHWTLPTRNWKPAGWKSTVILLSKKKG
jgi:hypothetical protein